MLSPGYWIQSVKSWAAIRISRSAPIYTSCCCMRRAHISSHIRIPRKSPGCLRPLSFACRLNMKVAMWSPRIAERPKSLMHVQAFITPTSAGKRFINCSIRSHNSTALLQLISGSFCVLLIFPPLLVLVRKLQDSTVIAFRYHNRAADFCNCPEI